MKLAFVFPGQGSQAVGMGKGFAEEHLDRASRLLGFDLKKICLEGPEEELKRTEVQQPAIFTVSAAAYDLLIKKGIKPDVVAGHSLGEYSALYAAGSISFEDGVRTVNQRGRFMQEAVPEGTGAMAALLGGERETIISICLEIGNVWPANFNSPGQVVISGKKESVALAGEKLKSAGVKRIIPLPVSAPFHCPLMKPAADKLSERLAAITINNARLPVYSNITARPVTDGGKIKELLVRQVTGSVLWEDSVKNMIDEGVSKFIEVGPGKVLAGLIKKISANVEVISYEEVN
ncbi:[acyl-carrier-protein] S-malonyltransferase [candidate division WOR-1 bacterium RIFOXYA12_FULL_52_29]|uniref:Malonyl CoA-acyl carrier protein transacylase n=1 Tax=candidate division WOR-1 bacterium RIFOXYC12_FULL_54_18 TaxID=1802584 RepID=A0A1F4T7G1_UNCSA|nr:MAG: [acyl-carrier-protein] S-malonyltransferase [candidate division WOR-1 bacterium RIFOXYA2_FULL_51_19]OGC18042.1 MAG: [acyl-carrier-protein] S-malonyltransferase [candidate division WOR-1 bacterium RIFOXYA12_FULL_52_29]OGC26898.1 MAG: [acyl-carrier-protein] S-malonyltransferase [candidate division WOR-1 bacterium RIFOXYB2_FULL_45_9]OGC28459.1 MAG: [acyl-carrier-protein] S-malonyltransferase [candidate division WOR-1 bacterium RIFOXYC12_FULL_54_18]OGC31086.1 MAG: [acyl-carrier-protein] S-m